MQLKNGFNITQSDMRPLLEQYDKQRSGVRTWRQLFGNAALGYNAQSDALKTDYADAISQAYMSNYAQRNAIASAGLSAGSTQQLLAQNRNDLHAAYEQYVRNYGSDAAKVASAYGEEVNAIEGALTERAQNFANLYNSAYRYLSEELYGSTRTTDEGILDYLKEHNLDWTYLKDEQGNPTDQLMPWSQVSQRLFNPDGTLTIEGQEFYDQMFNSALDPGYVRYDDKDNEYATRDFRQWLSDRDNDLFNWWIGQDNYNYNLAGTNQGTANTLQGRESTDDEFHQSDYLTDKKVGGIDTSAIATNVKDSEAYHKYQTVKDRDYGNVSRDEKKVAQYDMFKSIRKEVDNILALKAEDIYGSNEAKRLLGDRYTDFIMSDEYKDARKNLDEITGTLRNLFRDWDSPTAYLVVDDDFISKYERYISDYKKVVEEYRDALKNYGTRTSKKSSGF